MSYLDSLFGLDGQTAVVTGATSGLGAASALALAQAGARVIVSGRDRERGERVVAQIADTRADAAAELELADVSD
ncbi:MAG: SDR family NAD(P)-dependent oxidoreductase [Solirubrobacteraceae bacterium]